MLQRINLHTKLTWFFLRAITRFVIRPNGRPSWMTSPSVASDGTPRTCRTRLALLPSILAYTQTNIYTTSDSSKAHSKKFLHLTASVLLYKYYYRVALKKPHIFLVDVICVNMPVITSEDKALIKVLRVEKGWTVDRMMCEFPARQWKRRTLYDLVR